MNEVVLITGASTGFGRTASEALAQRGYRVFATMRDRSGRNASTAEALWSLAKREGWNLDVLDNAGIGAQGITEAYTVEQFQQVFDVNLLGVVRVNRAVLPAMRRQRSGLLIHVGSGMGRALVPGFAAYSASKFALEALADAYRYELSQIGIDSVVLL